MPRTTLKVTDPRNGQVHEITAKRLDQVRNDNPHKATDRGVDVADGKIDLFVRSENNWRGGQHAASPDRQRPPLA